MNRSEENVMRLVKSFYKHPVPAFNESCDVIAPDFVDASLTDKHLLICIDVCNFILFYGLKQKFTFVAPNLKQLPSIPEDVSAKSSHMYMCIDDSIEALNFDFPA